MKSFEKVAWKSLNKNGTSGKESKSHLMQANAEKTLCGSAIPPQDQLSEEYANGECKRCAKAAEKSVPQVKAKPAKKQISAVKKEIATVKNSIATAVVKYAFHDWLIKLNDNDTLPRGKFFKAKKAA